jgi:hypothetical protein
LNESVNIASGKVRLPGVGIAENVVAVFPGLQPIEKYEQRVLSAKHIEQERVALEAADMEAIRIRS